MPIQARLFNGQLLEFPDDTPMEVVNRVAQEQTKLLKGPEEQPVAVPPPPPQTQRTVGQSLADLGAGAIAGTGSILAFPGQIASLVPGLRGVGSAIATPGEAIREFGEGLKSEGLKVREALRSQAISEAEKEGVLASFATAITSTLKDPALISTFLAEQVPMLLPPLAAARLYQILGRGAIAAAERGLVGEAAQAAAQQAAQQVNRRAYAAAVGTGAAMQGADISSDTYKRAYEAAIAQGQAPDEAETNALNAARLAFTGATGVSLLTQRLPGARAIEERFARLPGSTGRIKAGLGEATQEGLEEAGGALFQNLGVRTVDPNAPLLEGVGAAAGLGVIGGGVFGSLLGKRGTQALAPGQREGESLEQTVTRLSTERANLLGQLQPTTEQFPSEIKLIEMINRDPERAYSTIVKHIQSLEQLPESEARTAALQTAEGLRQRLSVEDIQRQIPSRREVITAQELRQLGFAPQDPIVQQLSNKDLAKPEDAVSVLDTIKTELQQENISPKRYEQLVGMREAVDALLAQIPGSAFYAGEVEQPGVGERTPVVEPADRQSAEAAGTTERGGVAAPSEFLPKPAVATAESSAPIEFETAKGSVYKVDDEGRTSRTKRSPGEGQGQTYDYSDVLYVTPEHADAILDESRVPFGVSVRLGYRDGNVFKSVATRAEIPAGVQPYVAVVNRDSNTLIRAFPAQMDPVVGMSPVEKMYNKDGTATTHIGNPIVKMRRVITKDTLKALGIKPISAQGKRLLGKDFNEVKKSLKPEELEAKFRELETKAKQPAKPTQPKEPAPPTAEEVAIKDRIAEIDKQLAGLLKKVLQKYGLNNVGVELAKDLEANGEYANRLIRLADNHENPILHLRHESIHALKDLGFFTPQQWSTLEDKARTEWVNTFLKNVQHNETQSRYDAYMEMFKADGKTDAEAEQAIVEEAIADAFSYFQKAKPPAGLIASINNRIKNFFKAIKEFLRVNDLTAEDIFGKIEAGELKPAKDQVPSAPVTENKLSLVEGVPRSSRMIMEADTKFAQAELGLKTERQKGATGANNVREIASALNKQTLANFGEITANDVSAVDANNLAKALADEVGYQLRATAITGTGLGWYSNNYPKAVDKLSSRFPELKTNKTARDVFTACVAVSSNGEDVSTNIKNAILMYEDVRAGKRIREIGVRRADAFADNKERITELLERFGDNFSKELLKTTTVRAMNAALRAQGQKTDSAYLANTEVPVAAIYFGPKLGAFYANLMGAEGYLTMDMWWTRTINRMRGLLMPKATESSINKFRNMMGQPDATRDEVVAATIPFRNKYEQQGYITELEFLAGEKEPSKKAELPAWIKRAKRKAGPAYDQLEFEHRLEKMANTIYKNEYEMLEEAPFTGSDRAFMYKVARDAQKLLKQEKIDLSLADIQAAIWYYEKRLYAKLSGRLADDIGYDEAITKNAAGARPAGPSVVFPDQPNAGYVTPREDTEADRVRGEPEEGGAGEVKRSIRSQTQTPAFKQWFGDSKVVDENGEPLVLYHGTSAKTGTEAITQFKPSKEGSLGSGIYLTPDPEFASSYTEFEGGYVLPVFARLSNPLILDGAGDPMVEALTKLGVDADKASRMVERAYETKGYIGKEVENRANLAGYDGLMQYRNGKLAEVVVYYNANVKSATGNVGDFKRFNADIRKSLRSQTQTPAFKQWFGDSKIVDENGNPKVMYHGTARDITEFRPKQANAIFVTDSPRFAESFADMSEDFGMKEVAREIDQNPEEKRAILVPLIDKAIEEKTLATKQNSKGLFNVTREDHIKHYMELPLFQAIDNAAVGDDLIGILKNKLDTRANIMPVFVRAENPFDFEDAKQVQALIKKLNEPKYNRFLKPTEKKYGDRNAEYLESGSWKSIEAERVQDAIKSLGHDGFYVMEGGIKNLAVYDPTQIKSAIGNVGTFSPAEPDIRKSLRSTLPPTLWNRVDNTIGQRHQKTWIKRITDAISPTNWSDFRTNALNRYEGLARIDRMKVQKMGGARLLADQSAEAAALMSDLGSGISAAAFGVHDRIGGYPIFKNGVVTIENKNGTVKGPLAIFAPLAAYGDPEIFRVYQFWVTAQRGQRLNAEGRLTPFDAADMAEVKRINNDPRLGPLFKQVKDDWIKYNDGLVKFLETTGVITPEASKEFRIHGDYFPMYKYMEQDDVAGPRVFSSIANVPVPKKLKGDEVNPMGDFFENVVRNTQSAIQMGIKNIAAQQATKVAMDVGVVRPLGHRPAKMQPEYYRVLEKGKEVFYVADDVLFMNAMRSLNLPDLPFIGFLAAPANLLRNLVTKTPDFMMANMLRDSVAAWVTSGTDITPVISTLKNFGAAIAEKSPELNALRNSGVLGGYDYAQGVEVTAKRFAKDLRKISKTRTEAEKLASPFTSIWEALEKGSAASDAATRMEVYKKTLDETGNEAEALFRALEVMNFNRKGRSPVIRILTASIPFLNARMQGLDVLYRAGIRPILTGDASTREKEIAKTFWIRGMTIMALSAMYWALTHDDDEYKKQEQETRDNYWLFPSMGIKIPIPFEIGVVFKVIPERIAEYAFGSDTGKDFVESMSRQLRSTFGVNYAPQAVLPLWEAQTNFSYFTQRPIIGQGMEDVAAPYQVAPTTSRTSQGLANAYNEIISFLPENVQKKIQASPIILDHLIQGYTGTMGTYAVQAIDAVINANSDIPSASKRFEQMPVIKRFALDPQARGTVSAYYDLKNSVIEVVRTSNLLERTGQFDEYAQYLQKNIGMLASQDYVNDLEKTMKDLREMKLVIRTSTMSGDAKREQLDNVERLEAMLTSNIQKVKKSL